MSQSLPRVAVGRYCCAESTNMASYRDVVGDHVVDRIETLSARLKGVRVCHINATAAGGGVAELLERLVPIYRTLGLKVDWRLIHGDKQFFTVTKGFHNGMQGGDYRVTSSVAEEYLAHNRAGAESLDDEYDVVFVHDPQPAAVRHFCPQNRCRWVWRCHIDSSSPNSEVWQFLRPYVAEYDAVVFTMPQFVPKDLSPARVAFIAPAIDPYSAKNLSLPDELCRRVMAGYGVNLHAPIVLQVSRFDPWKDPLGVIESYRLVKKEIPDIQLVLIGAMAGDDPEGWAILDVIQRESLQDSDVYVLTNMTGVGSMVVNAFQRGADVVVQKSLREGFGLVVSEAFWKERAVVAGAAGGIPMQFPKGYEANLVHSVDQCANRLTHLLKHPQERREFGLAAAEHVRRNFLLPRLVLDELQLITEIL